MLVSQFQLQCEGVGIVVIDPLIIPSNFLHTCTAFNNLRRQVLLLDDPADLART